MDFDLWSLIGHDCDLGHCSHDRDSSLQKPLNTIEYNGLYIIIINKFSKVCCAMSFALLYVLSQANIYLRRFQIAFLQLNAQYRYLTFTSIVICISNIKLKYLTIPIKIY